MRKNLDAFVIRRTFASLPQALMTLSFAARYQTPTMLANLAMERILSPGKIDPGPITISPTAPEEIRSVGAVVRKVISLPDVPVP